MRIKNKNIIWAIPNKPICLDPGLCGSIDGTDIINNTFEGLFRVVEKDTVIPGVVKSYICSNSGKEYIFTFRDDAYWSDGKKVLPKDFEFAWKRVLDSNIPSPKKNLFLPIKNAKRIIENKVSSSLLGIRAIDNYKLKLELEYPIDYLCSLLALTPFMPVREDVVDDEGLWAKNPSTAISNGPFYLSDYSNTDMSIINNKFYYNDNKTNINKISIKFVDNADNAYMGYISNNIDIIDNVPLGEYNKLAHSDEFISIPYYGIYFYSFNLNLDCLKNKNVRQAISKAIDREAITQKIRRSNEIPANEYIHIHFFKSIGKSNNKSLYNLTEAKKLFLDAGYNSINTFPEIEIFYNSENNNKVIAEAIQEMLKKNLNINVKLTGKEWSTFASQRRNLVYNGLAKNSHMYEFFDPMSFLQIFKPNNESYSGYENNIYNKILNKILTSNSKEKENLILHAIRILEDDMPIIPLFYYSSSSLVKSYIKNYHINSIGYKYLGFITLE